MVFGLTKLAVTPIRAEDSDRAEIVSQMLFGEAFEVIEEKEKWILVKTLFDNYEGWICRKQFFEVNEKVAKEHAINDFPVAASDCGFATDQSGNKWFIPKGSFLPFLHQNRIKWNDQEWKFEGDISIGNPSKIRDYAMSYLSTPYLWGGKSPLGIDCSGFCQTVFKMCGYKIPRDAYQQAEIGHDVSFIEMTELGDLAFFDNDEGRINHVALILEPGKVIHASGRVKIDKLDHQGIFCTDTNKYTHKLRLIKRIL